MEFHSASSLVILCWRQ